MSQEASGNTLESIEELLQGVTYDLRHSFGLVLNRAFDGEEGGDGNGDGEGDGSGDEGDGKEDGDGSSGTEAKPEAKIKDPEKKRLSDEAAKYRKERNEAKAQLAAAEKKVKEAEDKDKSELEKAQRDLKELQAKTEKETGILKTQAVELAFFKSGAAALFQDPEVALKLLDLGDIEIDDDGVVDSKEIKSRSEALVKDKKYLAKDSEDDGDEDEGGNGNGPSGRPLNKKRSKEELDRQALEKKFPALTRR